MIKEWSPNKTCKCIQVGEMRRHKSQWVRGAIFKDFFSPFKHWRLNLTSTNNVFGFNRYGLLSSQYLSGFFLIIIISFIWRQWIPSMSSQQVIINLFIKIFSVSDYVTSSDGMADFLRLHHAGYYCSVG